MRRIIFLSIACAALGIGVYATQQVWLPWLQSESIRSESTSDQPPIEETKVLKLSPQARKNLKLISAPVELQSYWQTIQVPGVVADRPGLSDRGVTSPVVGVVTKAYAFAGDTVRPGERLFTVRLFSEYLQNTQSALFKATQETKLINEERARLGGLAQGGAIAGKRVIELDQQLRRQEGLILAYRQDLLTRGLLPEQVEEIAQGRFVSTIDVVAPPANKEQGAQGHVRPVAFVADGPGNDLVYEVQELAVELGQQVQAGQLLAILSNHRSLYIEGHAFKREAPLLERVAQNGWPVRVEFAEDDDEHWPELEQTFHIRHLSNSIDLDSRTLTFFIPFINQSRAYERDGETFVVWRFRPGQRVRLYVPVEHLENVLVIPSDAVVREGPEAYVFRQNGNLFNRIPVEVLHEDRSNIVLALGGDIAPGMYLAQGSAASLNRVLKAQAAAGVRANVHVHADGTVHELH